MTTKKRVLVLCTGNSCRSQMAEGWLRRDLGEVVEAHSAGTHPSFVHPLAIRVMAEAGVDLSAHKSKSVSRYWEEPFDVVVTVCDSAREACPNFPGARKQLHESIPDPVLSVAEGEERALERFREVRDLIRKRIVPRVRAEIEP